MTECKFIFKNDKNIISIVIHLSSLNYSGILTNVQEQNDYMNEKGTISNPWQGKCFSEFIDEFENLKWEHVKQNDLLKWTKLKLLFLTNGWFFFIF